MNSVIRHGTLDDAVQTILKQDDEERCWQLYCANMANPHIERITFNDFMKNFGTNPNPVSVKPTAKKTQKIMDKKQIDIQVAKADEMLKSFTPTKKGGVL